MSPTLDIFGPGCFVIFIVTTFSIIISSIVTTYTILVTVSYGKWPLEFLIFSIASLFVLELDFNIRT
jgi:hypothetical protein